MSNSFFGWDASAPARSAASVTTGTPFAQGLARALYIGGAGNAVVVLDDDTTVTFNGLLAGTVLPVACKSVQTSGTSATDIVALF